MRTSRIALALAALMLSAAPAVAAGDETGDANARIVRAAQLIEQANASLVPEIAERDYAQALDQLDAILHDDPRSSVAAQLAASGHFGNLDLQSLKLQADAAEALPCQNGDFVACMVARVWAADIDTANSGLSDAGLDAVRLVIGAAYLLDDHHVEAKKLFSQVVDNRARFAKLTESTTMSVDPDLFDSVAAALAVAGYEKEAVLICDRPPYLGTAAEGYTLTAQRALVAECLAIVESIRTNTGQTMTAAQLESLKQNATEDDDDTSALLTALAGNSRVFAIARDPDSGSAEGQVVTALLSGSGPMARLMLSGLGNRMDDGRLLPVVSLLRGAGIAPPPPSLGHVSQKPQPLVVETAAEINAALQRKADVPVPVPAWFNAASSFSEPAPSSPTLPLPPPVPTPAPTLLSQPTASPAPAAQSSSWITAVSAWLDAHKSYPALAQQAGKQGTVILRFTVTRSGQVLGVYLLRGSGSAILDQAAEGLLRGAALPPFPATMQGTETTVTFAIRYNLEQ